MFRKWEPVAEPDGWLHFGKDRDIVKKGVADE
jgi:hypothetical protein